MRYTATKRGYKAISHNKAEVQAKSSKSRIAKNSERSKGETMPRWKDIAGYEGLYLVSDEGDVITLPRTVDAGRCILHRKARKPKKILRGRNELLYEAVALTNDGKTKFAAVHRLVAQAFIPNPNGYKEVNHIDRNTRNNCVDNLEWCDKQYNNEYSHNKPIQQYSIDGELLATYKSTVYATQITGIKSTCITNNLKGKSRTAGGYVWKYLPEEKEGEIKCHSQEKH